MPGAAEELRFAGRDVGKDFHQLAAHSCIFQLSDGCLAKKFVCAVAGRWALHEKRHEVVGLSPAVQSALKFASGDGNRSHA